MSQPSKGCRTWAARAIGRIQRLLIGDRVLVPRQATDPLRHLHRASRRIRGGQIVVRFDNLDADICLDARSDLTLRALGCGAYEPELLAVFPALVGEGDAINIGANVGIIAIALHRAMAPGRRLACIEPLEDCVQLLRRNLESAGIYDAIVFQAFAASEPGVPRRLWSVPGKPEYSSGGPIVHASVRDAATVVTHVPVVCLDDAVEERGLRPSAIVLDCEGGEGGALRGAGRTLRRFRPVILAEFDPALLAANGSTPEELLQLLREGGYRSYTLSADPAPVTPTFQGNIVALPKEQEDCLRAAFVAAIRGKPLTGAGN